MTAADRPGVVTRVLTWPLEVLVIAYQRLVSPLLAPSCRYYPGCSSYALTALRRFGPVVGTWLAVRRLARCHPWTAGGVDHVPPRGRRGLPDWAAYRRDAAQREATWEAEWAAEREAPAAPGVRNDDCENGSPAAAAPVLSPGPLPPVRRGMP
ncbi:MAG: membrane protein insertion efficiency factor YidD [Actinobacteria bacterium]|nr:membrane protein insertion efficiency factor YidD [Actinomycetota bacterium]